MRKIFSLGYVVMSVVLLVGCATYSELNFDILRPAKFSMPPEIKSVVLIDNGYPFRDTSVNVLKIGWQKFVMDTVWADDFGKKALHALKNELDARNFYDTVFIDSLTYNSKETGKLLRPLSDDSIQSIRKRYNADAIITIDGYRYNNEAEVMTIGEGYYYATLDASGVLFWRIYDTASGTELISHVQRDTIFWDGEGGSFDWAMADFPSFPEAAGEVASYLGYQFADFTAPHWETVNRRMYTSGNVPFVNATDWINQNNWDEAEKLWRFVFENRKGKQKARAALNLALAMENKGRFKEALYWSHEAQCLYTDKSSFINAEKKYAVWFYVEMAKRMREHNKIKQQVGGE
ncbi:hypothetical protein DMA11_14540 [Marinilabiliaceae bacterium JC017]|nr:hypothetical protein DMA11_14540 [Marinilabiliaceae bacterium JC017]